MTSTQSPRIYLALDDAMRNYGIGSPAVVWNPANVLRGTLEISRTRSFEINEATIFLEGQETIIRRRYIDSLRNHRGLEELGG